SAVENSCADRQRAIRPRPEAEASLLDLLCANLAFVRERLARFEDERRRVLRMTQNRDVVATHDQWTDRHHQVVFVVIEGTLLPATLPLWVLQPFLDHSPNPCDARRSAASIEFAAHRAQPPGHLLVVD